MNVKWSEIAASIPGRLGKQCRERWFNHLSPDLTKAPWTDQEDGILFHAQVNEHYKGHHERPCVGDGVCWLS